MSKPTVDEDRERREKGSGSIAWRPTGIAPGSPKARAYGLVTLPSGRRIQRSLGPRGMSVKLAEERLAVLLETAAARPDAPILRPRGAAAPGPRTTVKALGEDWTGGKLLARHGRVNRLRPLADEKTNGWRLGRCYAVRTRGDRGPTFGELAVADVTEQDVERVLADAPEADAAADTRLRFYSLLSRLFDLAIMPARLRKDSPVTKYHRPAKGEAKLFCYLYPAELTAVLACLAAPIGRRVLYALAAYTGLRKSSLLALTWRDIDRANGTLTALVTKNGVPQMFEIDAGLVWVATAWWTLCGKPDDAALVFTEEQIGCTEKELAGALRADLRAAGVTRAMLFTDDDPKIEPLRFHDLRASFTTWAKRAGKSDGWITDRTGHLEPRMVARYTRAARHLADLRMVPFPSLIGAIAGLDGGDTHTPQAGEPCTYTDRSSDDLEEPEGTTPEVEAGGDGAQEASSVPGVRVVAPGVAGSNPVTHPVLSGSEGGSDVRNVIVSEPPQADAVEAAMSRALEQASAAGRWDVVAALAAELRDRRLARAEVVVLADRRRRDRG